MVAHFPRVDQRDENHYGEEDKKTVPRRMLVNIAAEGYERTRGQLAKHLEEHVDASKYAREGIAHSVHT